MTLPELAMKIQRIPMKEINSTLNLDQRSLAHNIDMGTEDIAVSSINSSEDLVLTCHNQLNRKDLILGPHFFGQSISIKYLHEAGMIIQVWNQGD